MPRNAKPPEDVKAPALRDIAEELGLSRMTVHRVLKGDPRVADDTRRLVQEALDRRAYRGNPFARSLHKGRFEGQGLLVWAGEDSLVRRPGFMAGLQSELTLHEQYLVIAEVERRHFAGRSRKHWPRLLREKLSDGMIFSVQNAVPAPLEDFLTRAGIPWIGLEGDAPINQVRVDHSQSTRLAVESLRAAGCSRPVYYGPCRPGMEGRLCRMREGYVEAMGGEKVRLLPADSSLPLADQRNALEELLSARRSRPDALIVAHETSARLALHVAERLGLRVPGDLRICLAETMHAHSDDGRVFTATHLSTTQVGRAAATLLLHRIDNGADAPSVAVPYTWQEADT